MKTSVAWLATLLAANCANNRLLEIALRRCPRERLRVLDDCIIRSGVSVIIRFFPIEHHEVTYRSRSVDLGFLTL